MQILIILAKKSRFLRLEEGVHANFIYKLDGKLLNWDFKSIYLIFLHLHLYWISNTSHYTEVFGFLKEGRGRWGERNIYLISLLFNGLLKSYIFFPDTNNFFSLSWNLLLYSFTNIFIP